MRKQIFDRMEAELQKTCKPEERMLPQLNKIAERVLLC